MSERVAYLAGFFDGEGHIAIVRRTDARKRHKNGTVSKYLRFCLNIAIGQTTRDVLDLFHAEFGGSIAHTIGKRSYDRGTYYRWDWRCGTAQASNALTQMLPFLIVKREQALLAVEFQSSMGERSLGPRGHGPEMRQYRQSCFDGIRNMRQAVKRGEQIAIQESVAGKANARGCV
jgi:hypothetical protein